MEVCEAQAAAFTPEVSFSAVTEVVLRLLNQFSRAFVSGWSAAARGRGGLFFYACNLSVTLLHLSFWLLLQ